MATERDAKMIILLFTFTVIFFVPTNSHLVQKNYEKTTTEHVETTLRTRLARDVFEETTVAGVSNEFDRSHEIIPKTTEPKPLFRSKPAERKVVNDIRVPRESGDHPKVTDIPKSRKQKVLVKKPIPKYNDLMDYDDEFQMKIIKSGMKLFQDSGEHEDQDFNVDDYEFDVNHDEFNTGGKHYEPRLKNKKELEQQVLDEETTRKPEPPLVKIKSKVVTPTKAKGLYKRHNQKISNKAGFKVKDDYFDDVSTSKGPSNDGSIRSLNSDDNINDKNADSKEEHKYLRSVRSPWIRDLFTNKAGEKTATILGKLMGILPMFPSSPLRQRLSDDISTSYLF